MSEHAITAVQLTKSFGGKRGVSKTEVLQGVSLDVDKGQLTAVVGPSGAGKSTLLYLLAGLERPDSGSVNLCGSLVSELSTNAVAKVHRQHVGFIFQTLNLIPSLTATENVLLPSRLARQKVDRAKAQNILSELGLSSRVEQLTSKLSIGEQQRTAMARVIYSPRTIVFADEPTGSLDSQTGDVMLLKLREMADAGRAVVMVTHDLEAASRADVVLVVRDGQIAARFLRPSPSELWSALHPRMTAGMT